VKRNTSDTTQDEEQLHRQRMAELEAKAQGYVPVYATVDAAQG
jgi:hypothetical protein